MCEIRPKPPVEYVSTVEPSSARVPRIRRAPQATPKHRTRTRAARYESKGKVQISKCERRGETGNVEEEILPRASMTDRRPRHSLHQRLLQPPRNRVDQERTRQAGPLLPLSNQREPHPKPHSHRAAVTVLPMAGTTASGRTATSSSMALARSQYGSERRRRRPRSPHELPGGWSKVRTQFRPWVRTQRRTFS